MKKKLVLLISSLFLSLTGCVSFETSSHSTGEGSLIQKSSFSIPVSQISAMSIPSETCVSVIKMKNDSIKGVVPANQTEIKGWMKDEPQIISTLGAYDNVTLAPYQSGVSGGLMLGTSYTSFSYITFTTTKNIKGMIITARPGFNSSSEDPEVSAGFSYDTNVMVGLNNYGFIALEGAFTKPSEVIYTKCSFTFSETNTFTIAVNNRRAIIDKIELY